MEVKQAYKNTSYILLYIGRTCACIMQVFIEYAKMKKDTRYLGVFHVTPNINDDINFIFG